METGRLSAGRLALHQIGYAVTALWRTRMVLIFTFAMPVVWLVVIGIVAGNETVDPVSGVRVMQFVTPVAVAMGTFFATFPTLATSLSEARESGVLKRLRGTPLPAWVYLVGQIGAAVIFAAASFSLTITVAVVAYGVEVQAETALALTLTLLVGISAFSALGLAVATVSATAATAQAIAIGASIVLAFISGVFVIGGDVPGWLSRIAAVFPLKPYTDALKAQFDPFQAGSGWDPGALAVIAAWGAVGALVAAWAFRRQPGATTRMREPVVKDMPAGRSNAAVLGAAGRLRRPAAARLVFDQARAANRATWRDPGSVLFVIIPVGLYALLLTMQGNVMLPGGIPFATFFAAGMITWGAGTAVFMNLPEAVARARDRGVLKRLRGTPLSASQYLAGVTAAGLALTFLIAVLVSATGFVFFDLRIPAAGLAVGALVILIGTLTLAACGFLLAALVPNARAVGAVGLMFLFVLSFVSDVFIVGGGPDWLSTFGALFPLKHLQNALVDAWDPNGPVLYWVHYAVLLGWAAGTAALAVRFFRWEPRRG